MSTDWIDVSDITPRIAFTATASQTAFTVPFVFFENSDLLVYQNSVLLTLATNYTVTGAESETGGTVTFLVGATAGDAIMIVRDIAIEQTTHIPPSGPLDIAAVNVQISKLIAIDQQARDKIIRSLRQRDSEVTVDMQLPADRANKVLGFDGNLNPVAVPGAAFISTTDIGAAFVSTRAVASVTIFSGSVLLLQTGGTATVGDGGALTYKRGSGAGSFTDGGGVSWVPFTDVNTANISNAAVTYAKIQNVAASRLLGNPTGSPAAPSEISLGANGALAFSGTTLTGSSVAPTIQRFFSGSGTYTTPAGCKWIRIRLVGAGAGGAGGNNSSASSAGGSTTFSGGTLSGGGGAGGSALSEASAGGTASGGNVLNISGGGGTGHGLSTGGVQGGAGGDSYFGGGGGGGANPNIGGGNGGNATANSGSGGGGGGAGSTVAGGTGGAAGGYVEHIISGPAASYTYAVGAGSAGIAGTSAGNGGNGANGIVIVEEYY